MTFIFTHTFQYHMYHYCILLSSPSTCLSNLLFIRMWVLVVVCLCMLEPIEASGESGRVA